MNHKNHKLKEIVSGSFDLFQTTILLPLVANTTVQSSVIAPKSPLSLNSKCKIGEALTLTSLVLKKI